MSSHPTIDLTISNVSPAVINQGLNIPHGTHALEMTWEEYGDFIRTPLFIVGSGAATIGVLTVNDCGDPANDAKEVPGGWNTVRGYRPG